MSVAQEHFVGGFVRGRLLGLARLGQGGRPPAVVACAPGAAKPALIAFGLALRARGWRIAYLGTARP